MEIESSLQTKYSTYEKQYSISEVWFQFHKVQLKASIRINEVPCYHVSIP